MYNLKKEALLGKGAHRECYEHPENEDLCIKIIYSIETSGDKEIKREMALYKDLGNRLTDWSRITKFHGCVKTNLGTGYVYDLIKNADSSKSETMELYIKNNRAMAPLLEGLKDLHSYMMKNRIPTMTIKPKNIMCKIISPSKVTLVIVDNLGDSTLIPIYKYSEYLFKKRFDKKWNKFLKSININL